MTRRIRLSLVLLAAAVPLVYFAFRQIPLHGIRDWSRGFSPAGIAAILLFEIFAWFVMGERWRWFCRESGASFPPMDGAASRLAGFAWSYITPGPHFGGEPFQIIYLSERGYPSSLTLPALIRDRGYELISGLLTAALLLLIPGGDHRPGIRSLIAAVLLAAAVAAPAFHRGSFRVLARIVLRLVGRRRRRRAYELLVSTFRPPEARQRSAGVRIVLSLSLLMAPLLIIAELALFFALSGTPIGWKALLLLAAVSRISHYAPVPGAAGVYDAGIIGAAAWIQLDLGTTAAYVLMTRLRDLIQVSGGLAITMRLRRNRNEK